MGPKHRIRIYIGFDSPYIIRFRFLEPLISDVFKTRFEDYHFDENIFPSLEKEKLVPEARQKITWNNPKLSHFVPRTNHCELEAQNIIHLQNIATQLPDVFTSNEKVVKSHIPTANTPSRIEIPEGKKVNIAAIESILFLKGGRLNGVKDKNPR